MYNDDGVGEDVNLMNHHWRFLNRAVNMVYAYMNDSIEDRGESLRTNSIYYNSLIQIFL